MNPIIRVLPESISFKDLDIGDSDSMEVSVTNISLKTIHLRFSVSNPLFTLSEGPDFVISPGLTVSKEVSYIAEDLNIERATLSVLSDECHQEIPIVAYPPLPILSVNTNKLDFGNITVTSNQSKKITLFNFGSAIGTFELAASSDCVILSPSSGEIEPNRRQDVSISLQPPKPGMYKFMIHVKCDMTLSTISDVEVNANVIDQSIAVIENGIEVNQIDFGHAFYGQKISKKVIFRNKGPIKHEFTITATNLNGDAPSKIFSTKEDAILIGGFEEKEVEIFYSPPSQQEISLTDSEIKRFVLIQTKSTSAINEVIFFGTASSILTNINPIEFDFGIISINDRITKNMSIENKSIHPINFALSERANYVFVPSSGVIKPGEIKEIGFCFKPNSLGRFNTFTNLEICNGLIKKKIGLTSEAKMDPSGKPFRRTEIWETNKEAKFKLNYPDNPFCMTLSDVDNKRTLQRTFHKYITDSADMRVRRNEKQEIKRKAKMLAEFELGQNANEESVLNYSSKKILEIQKKKEEVDFGIKYGEGLVPPEPKLLSFRAKLNGKLEKDASISLRKTKKTKARKLKTKPTTKLEISETSRVLTVHQLLSVISSEESIDFGNVPVFSSETREFSIQNNLMQHIFVSFQIDDQEFSKTTPLSQVIYPQQSGVFHLNIEGIKIGEINTRIRYCVNNQHEYAVNVKANIIPLELKLSERKLKFRFEPDQTENFITKTVKLTNPTNVKAQVHWTGFNEVFSARPVMGFCPPKGSTTFEITYRPSRDSHSEVRAVLNVLGGPQKYLKCVGYTGEPQITINTNVANFDTMPIGISKTMEIMMENKGSDPGLFNIYPNFTDVLNISPPTGKIMPGEIIPIQIHINSAKECNFDVPITISASGMKPVTFDVIGSAEAPHIDVDFENDLNFGMVFTNSTIVRHITLSNPSIIPATIDFDLTGREAFKIDYSPKLENRNGKNSINLISKQGSKERRYQIYILPNTSVEFDFSFSPLKQKDYSMTLPLSSKNIKIASSKSLEVNAQGLLPPLEVSSTWLDFGVATLMDPLNPNIRPTVRQLVLTNKSRQNIKFKFDTSEINTGLSVEPSEGVVEYASNLAIFVMFKPESGTFIESSLPLYAITSKSLNYGKALEASKSTTKVINVGDEEMFICSNIQLSAVINSNKLSMSQDYVALPPVPVNIPVTRTVYVENVMFIEADLNIIVPVNEKIFPITLEYPNGTKLTHTTEKLPIVITFMSPKPMAFSTQIAVADSTGNACHFTVSAFADNSIFSLTPFIKNNELNFNSNKHGQIAITMKQNNTGVNDDFLSYVQSIMDINDYKWEKETYDSKTYNFLTEFLNTFCFTEKISDIATDFRESDCDKLIDLISILMGQKKPPSLANIQKMKCETDEEKLSKAKSLINLLSSQGCLLSQINPLFLMQKGTFIVAQKKYLTKLLLSINSSKLSRENMKEVNKYVNGDFFQRKLTPRVEKYEKLFNYISRASWLSLILQVMKVLYVGKFQVDSFNKIPGVEDAINDNEKAKLRRNSDCSLYSANQTILSDTTELSETVKTRARFTANYMTQIETTLVKWVAIHVTRVKSGENIPHNLEDLRNPLFFGFLIKSHIPSLKLGLNYDGRTLRAVCEEDNVENAKIVIRTLKKIGIRMNILPEDITNGSHEMLALITFQLIQTLPHYLPSEELEFEAKLNSQVEKIVSIQNPSKQDITYTAFIEGSKNFSLANSYFTIKPGQTYDLVVKYKANTHTTETGKLSIIQSDPHVFEPKLGKDGSLNPRKRSKTLSKPKSSAVSSGIAKDQSQIFDDKKEVYPPSLASPIIFNLISTVNIGAPDDSIVVSGPLYEVTKKTITVPNKCGVKGEFILKTLIMHTTDDNGNSLVNLQTYEANIRGLFGRDRSEEEVKENNEEIPTMEMNVKKYKAFIFMDNKVVFSNKSAELPIEFVPIDLGKYKCVALFKNEEIGEFLVEITGETEIPKANETTVTPFACKTRALSTIDVHVPMEAVNRNLVQAISYSITKNQSDYKTMSALKQKEVLSMNVNEVTAAYLETVNSITYSAVCSSEFYTVPEEVTFSISDGAIPSCPAKFAPKKPGVYAAKIVLADGYDIRVLNVVGTALAAEENINIELETISGKKLVQEFPLDNTSSNTWKYIANIEGDVDYFNYKEKVQGGKFTIAPKSTYMFALNFISHKVGVFNAVVTFVNSTKESIVKYNVKATVSEPFAEEKLELEVHARDILDVHLDLPKFIKEGDVEVTSDLDILFFPETIHFTDGKPDKRFLFNVSSNVSGKFVGTLTFTHKESEIFCWYIVEVNVTSPIPSDKFEIKAIQRETFVINIGMSNPKDHAIEFSVTKSDEDLIGSDTFIIDKETEDSYKLSFTPFRTFERISHVTFINKEVGEFVFTLDISVQKPEPVTLAPMVANVGKSVTTYITLSNNTEVNTTFEVSNTNPDVFHILEKNIIVMPKKTKTIGIKYIPTSIGVNQDAVIEFISPHMGEYIYKLCGQGKPPPPQSPLIVEAPINSSNSGSVTFFNPFPFPMTFDIFLHSEVHDAFVFLQKMKSFTLNYYMERQPISFMFNSNNFGQFSGSIMVSTHSQDGCIAWKYPLIGITTVGLSKKVHTLTGKAKVPILKEFTFYLPGESEFFDANAYKISVDYEEYYKWVSKYIETKVEKVMEDESGYSITLMIKFTPRKPLDTNIIISVENELNQKWEFPIHATVVEGDIDSSMTVESSINIEGSTQVVLKHQFTQKTDFTAYFKPGSSTDLYLSSNTGLIEESISDCIAIPLYVLFKPKVYGKLNKGILVIETEEAQFLISITGKLPDYVPPVISKSAIDTHMHKSKFTKTKHDKNRNTLFKDTFDSVRITKPRSARRRKPNFDF